jgi:hypothetical protein
MTVCAYGWTPEGRDKLITDEVLRIVGLEHVKKHFLSHDDGELQIVESKSCQHRYVFEILLFLAIS